VNFKKVPNVQNHTHKNSALNTKKGSKIVKKQKSQNGDTKRVTAVKGG